MMGFTKYLLVVISVLLSSFNLYAENEDGCSTYFITQPFTGLTNPTYDSKEYIKIIDEPNPTISSSLLETKSEKWYTRLKNQKDTATVLSNLLTISDISMDEALYVISSSIIPTLSGFINIDSQAEIYRFHELLADVLGLKDIETSIIDIQRSNKELTSLLRLWSPKGLKRASTEIAGFTNLIRRYRDFAINHEEIKAVQNGDKIVFRVKNPFTRRMETILLSEKLKKELHGKDWDAIPKKILEKVSGSRKYRTLNKVLDLNEKEIFMTIAQGLMLPYFPKINHEIKDAFDAYCWYTYYNALKAKTVRVLGKLLQSYKRIQIVLEESNNSSEFLQDNTPSFLNEIKEVIEKLKTLHASVSRFDIQDVVIKFSDMPKFSLFKFVIPDDKSYWEFTSYDIYLRLLRKGPLTAISKYNLFENPSLLATPSIHITETLCNSLTHTYNLQPIDRAISTHVYDYFTNFSYLQSEDYQTYLSTKYGTDFTEHVLKAITE